MSMTHALQHARKKGWLNNNSGKAEAQLAMDEEPPRPMSHIMRKITPPYKVLVPNMACMTGRLTSLMYPVTEMITQRSSDDEAVLQVASAVLPALTPPALTPPSPLSPQPTSMPFCEPRASPKQLSDILSIPLPEEASFARDLELQSPDCSRVKAGAAARWWWPF